MYESGEAANRLSPEAVVALGVAIDSINKAKKFEWAIVCGLHAVGHSEFSLGSVDMGERAKIEA